MTAPCSPSTFTAGAVAPSKPEPGNSGRVGVPFVADAVTPEDAGDRADHDAKVEAWRAVVDVPDIHVELLVPRQRVAPVGLCPPGDAGEDVVAAGMLQRVAGQIVHRQRPWAHQAHVAPQDVDEGGQLVEARGSEHPPERGEADAIGLGPLAGGGGAHGAELHQLERLTTPTRPGLPEQDRRPHRHPQSQRDGRQHGETEHQDRAHDDDVEQTRRRVDDTADTNPPMCSAHRARVWRIGRRDASGTCDGRRSCRGRSDDATLCP